MLAKRVTACAFAAVLPFNVVAFRAFVVVVMHVFFD